MKTSARSSLRLYRRELRALLTLGCLLLLALGLRLTVFRLQKDAPYPIENSKKLAGLIKELKEHRSAAPYVHPQGLRLRKNPSVIDPNTAGDEELSALGLKPGQIKNIRNYQRHGGRFRRPEDLLRMYTISDDEYARMKQYISIQQERERSHAPLPRKMKPPVYLDLNHADSAALTTVRGLGPVLSQRIVKYRERLGGFYAVGQLREVFGIDSVRFAEIRSSLFTDSVTLRFIDINRASFEDLRSHPYIRYNLANAIVKYRVQHGFFRNEDDLRHISILPEEILRKIAPYLKFND